MAFAADPSHHFRRLIDVQKLHTPRPSLEDLAGFVKQHLHEEAYSLNGTLTHVSDFWRIFVLP